MAASSRLSLEQLFSKIQEGKVKDLPLILKTDVSGSMEVLSQALRRLSNEKVKISAPPRRSRRHQHQRRAPRVGLRRDHRRLQRPAREEGRRGGREGRRRHPPPHGHLQRHRRDQEGHGGPARPDAEGSRARPRRSAQHVQGAEVRHRRGLLRHRGQRSPRSAQVRLLRDNRVIYEGKIGSLRRFKDDVSEVKQGFECGIGLDKYQDVKVGDIIEAFQVEKVAGVMA